MNERAKLCIKGFNFSVIGKSKEEYGIDKARVVKIGYIHSKSGYLVICDPSEIIPSPLDTIRKMDEKNRRIFDDRYNPKGVLQEANRVSFSNNWGDGLFPVFSKKSGLYLVTDYNDWHYEKNLDKLKIKVKKEFGDDSNLEGIVGVGSGCMTITDPIYDELSCKNTSEFYKGVEEYGGYFTILKAPVGMYKCEFINKNSLMSITQA